MPLLDDSAIERLALAVINRTLPKSEWTHEGHFAAALWLCRNRPDLAEPDAIRALITGYNDSTLTANTDTSGYHHTITLGSMRAAAHHLGCLKSGTPIAVALTTLMASRLGHPYWPLRFWNRETLFSVAARRAWVEPNLERLPF